MIMEKATVHCPTIIPCHLIRNADTFLGLHSCIWQHYLFIVWTIYLQYHGIIYVFILIIVTDFISAALVLLNVTKWSERTHNYLNLFHKTSSCVIKCYKVVTAYSQDISPTRTTVCLQKMWLRVAMIIVMILLSLWRLRLWHKAFR